MTFSPDDYDDEGGAVILVGVPGTARGPLTTKCAVCNKKYSMAMKTGMTIAQLGPRKSLVVCCPCFVAAGGKFDNPMGVAEARRILGLDN